MTASNFAIQNKEMKNNKLLFFSAWTTVRNTNVV